MEMQDSQNQALVLVNYGNATGQRSLLSQEIFKILYSILLVHIEAEVNVI
jgi:UDP-N-acetylenolpyruvoylglucosamine reductase